MNFARSLPLLMLLLLCGLGGAADYLCADSYIGHRASAPALGLLSGAHRSADYFVQVGGSADPSDGNDIVLTVPELSGRHARFEVYPSGAVWLTDLGTTNGTSREQLGGFDHW